MCLNGTRISHSQSSPISRKTNYLIACHLTGKSFWSDAETDEYELKGLRIPDLYRTNHPTSYRASCTGSFYHSIMSDDEVFTLRCRDEDIEVTRKLLSMR